MDPAHLNRRRRPACSSLDGRNSVHSGGLSYPLAGAGRRAAAILGFGNIYVTEAIFFSQAAVVTFGGAYAVLAFIAKRAVETYGWLQPGEMLLGHDMAQTTPGPLIQVMHLLGLWGLTASPGPSTQWPQESWDQ